MIENFIKTAKLEYTKSVVKMKTLKLMTVNATNTKAHLEMRHV